MKQEVKRLELLLKENDSMFHEKEHIKTNFIKFLETAGAKYIFFVVFVDIIGNFNIFYIFLYKFVKFIGNSLKVKSI